jgi:hypothetical protein
MAYRRKKGKEPGAESMKEPQLKDVSRDSIENRTKNECLANAKVLETIVYQ